MEFVVDRSKWRSGGVIGAPYVTGKGITLLLNSEGFQCCLGFVCEQLGIERERLRGQTFPMDLKVEKDHPVQVLLLERKSLPYSLDSDYCTLENHAANVNDDTTLTRKQREKKLIRLFRDFGHTLKFVGEY